MKCPGCGVDNYAGAGVCSGCGRLLGARPASQNPGHEGVRPFVGPTRSPASQPTQVFGKVDHNDVAQKMRLDYSLNQREADSRVMDGIVAMMQHFHKPQMNIRSILDEAGNLIQRLFSLKEVAIGLRSSSDGLYRYEVLLGYRDEAEKAHRAIHYTEEDFWDETKYRSTTISRQTRLFLTEDTPYLEAERATFSRQVLLETKRTAPNECLEADYLDITIPGLGGGIIGWVEISGTRGGKLPDVSVIKWIEFIACVLGAAIACYDIRRIMARESKKAP